MSVKVLWSTLKERICSQGIKTQGEQILSFKRKYLFNKFGGQDSNQVTKVLSPENLPVLFSFFFFLDFVCLC